MIGREGVGRGIRRALAASLQQGTGQELDGSIEPLPLRKCRVGAWPSRLVMDGAMLLAPASRSRFLSETDLYSPVPVAGFLGYSASRSSGRNPGCSKRAGLEAPPTR